LAERTKSSLTLPAVAEVEPSLDGLPRTAWYRRVSFEATARGVRKLSAQHRKWQTRAKAAASPADLRHTVSLEQWQGLDPQVRDGLLDLGDETLT
jgi:hypothetical protein